MDDLFKIPFIWNNRKHFLSRLPCKTQIQFGLFCLNQVRSSIKDERCLRTLEVIELLLEGKVTKEECRAAAAEAYTSDDPAAYMVAYVANAADSSIAETTSYVTGASYVAATADEFLQQDQLSFLRKLTIENLSPEDRDCWLLVTLI